jgi:hypothetical protein
VDMNIFSSTTPLTFTLRTRHPTRVKKIACMETVGDSSKATEKMSEEAQRLWGPRADAPTDGVVWEVSKQAILHPDLNEADPRQVTSMEWEFHVADGVENLHAFIYNILDKAENTTVVDVSMENGMIAYVSMDPPSAT